MTQELSEKRFGRIGIQNKCKNVIPWQIVKEDGEVSNDKGEVLTKWMSDNDTVYQGKANDTMYDNYHLDSASLESDTWPDDTPNVESLNIDISLEDVQQAVAMAKLRKSYLYKPPP